MNTFIRRETQQTRRRDKCRRKPTTNATGARANPSYACGLIVCRNARVAVLAINAFLTLILWISDCCDTTIFCLWLFRRYCCILLVVLFAKPRIQPLTAASRNGIPARSAAGHGTTRTGSSTRAKLCAHRAIPGRGRRVAAREFSTPMMPVARAGPPCRGTRRNPDVFSICPFPWAPGIC